MAVLSKATIQRLALLRALSMWRHGAYGPVRLHKTLFFADRDNDPEWRLFTFKKWWLGQYSDEVSEKLNDLQEAGRIHCVYDGPSERIQADLSSSTTRELRQFFDSFFPKWSTALKSAFKTWAYLSNDDIITKAHDDTSYTKSKHGDIILESFDSECVTFERLDDEVAENLSDLVDVRLQTGLLKRLSASVEKPIKSEDWRHIYFGERRDAAKAI
jgi:uncharacterized protein YwgA